MGTRSNIIVEREDGKWCRIYSHWDGYPSHHGPLLLNHYNRQARAKSLVSYGDLSSLDRHNNKPPGHSYDTPVKGHTVYCGRDRGEEGTEGLIGESLAAVWPDGDTLAPSTSTSGRPRKLPGYVGDADEGSETLKPLAAVVAGEEPEPTPNVKAFGGNFVIGTRK